MHMSKGRVPVNGASGSCCFREQNKKKGEGGRNPAGLEVTAFVDSREMDI
jgi:hypothetical protein